MTELARIAQTLEAALPRLAGRRGQKTVVKLGGSAMEEPPALAATLVDIALLAVFGQRVVVVHGGGKAIDRAMAAAGIAPIKVQGRRVTDPAALDTVVRVLAVEVNPQLVGRINDLGVRAAGLHTGSNQILFGSVLRLPGVDLGRVGEVTRVELNRLEETAAEGVVSVIPSLAQDAEGHWLNVNADDAATAVAAAWRADSLVFLTDTPGVLRDVSDPASRFVRLTPADVARHIANGAIQGGMIPKVQGCVVAVQRGVGRVLILDGRVHHTLLMELLDDHLEGTEIAS